MYTKHEIESLRTKVMRGGHMGVWAAAELAKYDEDHDDTY